ncbi:MAG: prepilin-type N-terminal cleavage/methylation domain-containing protein [bacterium]|nr:prepilin-type N-terminal cleavage/methylation domain-containing protein [bacterium]
MNIKNNKKRGFTLIEMVLYVALFAMFSLILINTLILMTKSFRASQIQSDIIQSSEIMERIARETRKGTSITTIASGDLKVRIEDGTVAGDSVEFVLSSGNISFYQDDVLIGNLNPTNTYVTAMTFDQITTTKSVAVKVVLSLRSTRDAQNKVYNFYDTIVLRQSY